MEFSSIKFFSIVIATLLDIEILNLIFWHYILNLYHWNSFYLRLFFAFVSLLLMVKLYIIEYVIVFLFCRPIFILAIINLFKSCIINSCKKIGIFKSDKIRLVPFMILILLFESFLGIAEGTMISHQQLIQLSLLFVSFRSLTHYYPQFSRYSESYSVLGAHVILNLLFNVCYIFNLKL